MDWGLSVLVVRWKTTFSNWEGNCSKVSSQGHCIVPGSQTCVAEGRVREWWWSWDLEHSHVPYKNSDMEIVCIISLFRFMDSNGESNRHKINAVVSICVSQIIACLKMTLQSWTNRIPKKNDSSWFMRQHVVQAEANLLFLEFFPLPGTFCRAALLFLKVLTTLENQPIKTVSKTFLC